MEISVNGRHVQTATVGDFGVIETEVMWGRFAQKGPTAGKFQNNGRVWSHGWKQDCQGGRNESLRWSHSEVKVGDVVTIRVIEVDTPTGDQPEYRRLRGEPQQI